MVFPWKSKGQELNLIQNCGYSKQERIKLL